MSAEMNEKELQPVGEAGAEQGTQQGQETQQDSEKKQKKKKKQKKHKPLKVILTILLVVLLIYLIMLIVNIGVNISLRNYIKTFEPVAYSSGRIVPVMEDGHYTITTDEDLRVMHITDIHIGGGFWSYNNDKKTIYEVITSLQAEKPDIVILGGDNTYCVPGFGFNGGNTCNNYEAVKTVMTIFSHEQVYYSTVFGNHDTEAFDYANRQKVGQIYMNDKSGYCIFSEEFTDLDAETIPSVSNQFIVIKNTAGETVKLLLLIDSNAYVDTRFITSIVGNYDHIHEAQIQWAADTIKELSAKAGLPEGEYLKTICFLHIPVGEYRDALDDLITETTNGDGSKTYSQNADPKDTEFIEGSWGEQYICYSGYKDPTVVPAEIDDFFELLCQEMDSVEAIFCGHDHVNNAVVDYKGIMLAYGYSYDNEAYGTKIRFAGRQRGATVITVHPDKTFTQQHKNAYLDYGCETDRFVDVYLDKNFYPEYYRTVE